MDVQTQTQLVEALAAQLGLTVVPATAPAVEAAPAEPKKMTRAEKAKASGNGGNGNGKSVYGTAPVISGDPAGTQAAREAALEGVLPGFCKVAYVYPVGKNTLVDQPGQGKYTKATSQMIDLPWTWIELPGGRDFKIGSHSPDDVRTILKLAGYGYSASNHLWCCKTTGKPGGGNRGHARAQGVGKAYRDDEE